MIRARGVNGRVKRKTPVRAELVVVIHVVGLHHGFNHARHVVVVSLRDGLTIDNELDLLDVIGHEVVPQPRVVGPHFREGGGKVRSAVRLVKGHAEEEAARRHADRILPLLEVKLEGVTGLEGVRRDLADLRGFDVFVIMGLNAHVELALEARHMVRALVDRGAEDVVGPAWVPGLIQHG
jgi:hypothetical protein